MQGLIMIDEYARLNHEVLQVRSPTLRYHGAKFRLAPWIQQFFAAHRTYVDANGGGPGQKMEELGSGLLREVR
jgi:hypothetical protein